MRAFYNLFIFLYQAGINLSALFNNQKAILWKKGRVGLFDRLEEALKTDKKIVWFHCASVGEFEQSRTLLEKIKRESCHFILLTFFSPSGYESKKNYPHADHVDYLPLDSVKNARKFVEIVKPSFSFFAKYEFWFNILNELSKGGYQHFLISGIFRRKQQFFRFYGKWFRRHLENFTHLYVQDESTKILLNSFDIENVTISGDGRFDRVIEVSNESYENKTIEDFVADNKTIVFGSSWEKENKLAFQLAKAHSNIRIIIAPHEFHKDEIEKLNNEYQVNAQFLSNYVKGNTSNLLVIDQMGILSKLYRYGDVAVIGGGFGKGIHNILEAAVYGMPVLFGPNYDFFLEAKDLIEKKGAKVFKNDKQFHEVLSELMSNEKLRADMAGNCKLYFEGKKGSTQLIFNHLNSTYRLTI